MRPKDLFEELLNIAKSQPLWPGDTITHATANALAEKGLVKRLNGSGFILAESGRDIVNRLNGEIRGYQGNGYIEWLADIPPLTRARGHYWCNVMCPLHSGCPFPRKKKTVVNHGDIERWHRPVVAGYQCPQLPKKPTL